MKKVDPLAAALSGSMRDFRYISGSDLLKRVEAELEEVSLAGNRATALALVFSELFQNALEHGGQSVRVELARRNGDVVLAIADDGEGIAGEPSHGTGLSIVRALVRDELQGTLSLETDGGLRAEVVSRKSNTSVTSPVSRRRAKKAS